MRASSAIVDENVQIGEGTKIWNFTHICRGAVIGKNCIIGEGVHIGPGVKVGDNCKIQNHAILYKGVELEDNVFIGPNVVTTNELYPKAKGEWDKAGFRTTLFKRGSSIGAGSVVLCGTVIGENCLVGAGSLVLKDTEADSVYYGHPAIKRSEKHGS